MKLTIRRLLPSKMLTALAWFISGGFVMVDRSETGWSVRGWA